MPVNEVSKLFAMLGLSTQEQRESILTQGQIALFTEYRSPQIVEWISDHTSKQKEVICGAELERFIGGD